MIFKCKMCGGTLEVTEGASVAECPYCGAKQTLPKLDNERRANLYDRAGHFRRMSDFDKAMALYEQILNEDTTDAEAYWSIVLCRYGIEYVEDPMTHKRIPTVNRVQRTSILADEDYKSALTYADGYQRALYEAEAKEIEEIQKGILAISEKEEPFDVFICYKETDERGVRTRDSVLANDLYYELTKEGYKVFFSRITLEDKLGTAYEPYIFAALQSARVMVVVGTKAENFNAPWVKNEWSRYLALIRSGAKKTLIPAYRDMDPYDLPDAFSHLQAQDMSKLGFMQDLTRGIKKLLADDSKQSAAPAVQTATPAVPTVSAADAAVLAAQSQQALIKRAWLFLEDGDFAATDAYCEKVLDADPECSEAYFLKLLTQMGCRSIKQLLQCLYPLESNPNYQKAVRFATPEQRTALNGYAQTISQRIAAAHRAAEAEKARRQKKRRIIGLSILAILAFVLISVIVGFSINSYLHEPVTIDGVTYYRNGDSCEVRIGDAAQGDITLQSKCRGKPVTKIESDAFQGNASITSVTIPDSVTSIGDSAFYGCKGLTSITIPNSVKSIRSDAFKGCYKLVEVLNLSNLTITKGSTDNGYVGYYALNVRTSADSRSELITKDGYQFYEDGDTVYLLGYLGKETKLTLPEKSPGEKAYSIYRYAFYDLTDLTSVIIPNSVTSIGYSAFYGCTGLTSITIGNSVTSIGNYAFSWCTGLTSVTIGNSVTNIGNSAFSGCTGLTSITIPEGVTSIGNSAFYGCTNLTSITIPSSVTIISNAAFANCTSLTSITYTGTKTRWFSVQKGTHWSLYTGKYVVHCIDGDTY